MFGCDCEVWRREWDSHLAFLYVSCLHQHTAITLINQGPCVSPLVEILTIGTCIEQISDVYRHQPTPTNFKGCCSYDLTNRAQDGSPNCGTVRNCVLCAARICIPGSQSILASCTKHHNSDTLTFCRISRALMIGFDDLVYRCDKRTARTTRFVCWKRRSEPSSTARTRQMASPNRTTYSV
jgi:hypothetical protein